MNGYRILSLVTTVLVGLSGLPALSEAAEFHVAPSGNDANPGSLAAPFATVAGARDHIRAIRKAEMFPTDGVTVTIHAGTYELSEPLAFISEDSGTADAPIIYRAAAGDEVRLCAGKMLTGMTRVTNQAVLDRVDETARAHLQQIDIKVQGVTDYGEMSGGFGKKGSPGLEFFIADIPMVLARYPNTGFIPITEALGQTKKDVRGTKGCVEGVFAYDDDRPARWVQEKDAWVQGYWFWDWAEERQRVAAIDTAKRILTVSPLHHTFGYRKGQWFYGFNLLCEIDQPGEWYLDRAEGILYFWPPDRAPGGRAMVSLCKHVVTLTGASHLVLCGFVVEGARDNAIVVKDCTAVQVQACTVRNVGAWAVEVTGGTGVRVVGCDITGTGDGGVSLSGGDRRTLTPAGHVAENNNIHDYSRWNRVYRAGIKLEGVGNVARHNLIHHAPHQAIGFAGNDHVMEFNEIHNVCEESNDAGAIYAWCDWAARGNIFRFNHVHHCYGHNERSCAGIYLDDNWSACHIHGNVFHDVPKAVMLGGGRDHIVENNLFVNCKPPMHIDAVARLVSASLPLRSAAREVARHERLDLFDCIFGETPARAAFAQRHAARQVSGSGFRHPVVDALGSDLVSLWRLDEASGQRMDEISGENVTPLNAPGGDTGMRDGAAAFDRALSQGLRRELADVDALGFGGAGQSLTVALWFRVDSNNHDYRFLIGFNNVENYAFSWSLSVGYQNRLTAQLFTHQWDELYLSTGSIAAGQWHLVVLAYEASANRMRLFVDGALAGDMTGYSGPGNGGLLAPQAAFGIGCCDGMNWETYEPAPTGFFHGRIDEAAVWRSAPADPVLFAASLWNSGQGIFYEGDPIRRAVAPVRAEHRQAQGAIHRLRPTVLAETVLTGMAARFDAVAYRTRQVTAPHPAARCQAEACTPVGFEFIFGVDPTRATIAARPAAREMSGTGFGNSILDALMDHLVCCWKLEEGTGQRFDVISGENLTPHNTPTAGPGKDGQANRFSNSQANGLYRDLADLGPLATWGAGVELAVSTWLYADSLGYRSVLGFIDEMGYMGPWSMTVGYQNRLYLNVMTPDWDNAYVQSGSLVTGQWQHVFFTYNASGQLRLYLNGVLSATGSTYNGNGGLGQPYSPFTLGCGQAYDYEHDTYGYGNSWDGLIDETCVWNAAPPDPDIFAVALWQAGRGSFLYLDPRHRAVTTARGDLRAATATKKADRLLADQDLVRAATPARALATRYTVETNTGAAADARARAAADHAIRSDAEYIVALTRMLSAVRAGVRRDMDAVNCARTVLGLDARARTANASAAFLKALVVRLHADHRLRLGAGTKATFAASGDLFDIRAVNRVTTGEHPGARKLLVWTIPHLTSARDTTGKRVPLCFLARARQDALHPVRLTMRAPQGIAVPARHDAFIPAGWRLIARNPATGEDLDLGFVPANPDGSGGAVVDVALPDGDWQIEPRPAEWFWTDCMGRASTSVSIRDGRILHAGLPAILNLRGEILNQRRVVRWEIAAELLPQAFQFGIWAGAASPVDTTHQPLAAVPFAAGRGSYLYAFTQAAPLHLVVAAMAAGDRGPEAGIFLDWRTAAPASPANQLAR